MARMIPPVVGSGTTSAGEREIFLRLRDDPGATAWIALHSLGLARHDAGVAGEVDFVVIIPTRGVLCIEVKGCSASALRRDSGLWFYGPGDRGDPRSPFRQASEAMHSLRREILRSHAMLAGDLLQRAALPLKTFAVDLVADGLGLEHLHRVDLAVLPNTVRTPKGTRAD